MSDAGSRRRGGRLLNLDEPLFRSGGEGESTMSSGEGSDIVSSNWLFLERDYDQDAQALATDKIPLARVVVNAPHPARGFAFPEEYKNTVFEALGLTNDMFTICPTDVNGTFMLKGKHRVNLESTEHFNGQAATDIRRALLRYAPTLNVDFVVSCPHGRNMTEQTDPNKVFIRFYSIPSHYARVDKRYTSAYGFDLLDGQGDGLNATGFGFPITDDEQIVAEVVGDTIYVLFDLVHAPHNVYEIMCHIMEQYLPLKQSPEALEKHLKEFKNKEMDRAKRVYVRECGKRRRERVNSCNAHITQTEGALVSAQRTIIDGVQKLADLREELSMLEGNSQDSEYAKEFEKLWEIPGVKSVVVNSGVISVLTDVVKIEYGGKTYVMGKYRIDIPTTGRNNVKCSNLDNRKGDYFHPHIRADGSCCLGNLAEGIAKLIGEYQYSIVAQVMLQYLHSYNPDDAYTQIAPWG